MVDCSKLFHQSPTSPLNDDCSFTSNFTQVQSSLRLHIYIRAINPWETINCQTLAQTTGSHTAGAFSRQNIPAGSRHPLFTALELQRSLSPMEVYSEPSAGRGAHWLLLR